MIKRSHRLLGILAVVLGFLGSSLPAGADSVTILSVQTGHSIVVDAPGLTRVAVGDGGIAGVVPIGTSQLVINGKTAGHTTILVWMGGERATYEVTVTDQGVDDVARIIRAAINEPGVEVLSFGDNIVLRGTVADQAAYAQLQDLLSRFSGIKVSGAEAKLVNAVTIAHPLGSVQQEMASLPGGSDIHMDPDGQGNIVVSGRVHDRADAEAVLEKAQGLAGPYLATNGKVIDRLTTETSSEIDVKVYILEVDKTFQNTLGFSLGSTTTFQFNEDPIGATSTANGKAFTIGNGFYRSTLLAPTLSLLISQGHARLLSSPDLVTMPGQEATFLVGGQIPIPFSSGLGSVTIMYKDYGVTLDVTPNILGNGAIDTKITPTVSDLDFPDGVTLNGFVVPALKTSTVTTEVITQGGEAIVLGGLLRHEETRTIDKIPVLGDLPILGPLFRSTAYQNNDTDVVFVMQPTIISR
ncbi:MAG TPA: pilus assembly protein N-terminal domain-containing protein [Candidatus Acidoferrales bacterium]|nr:pilus assembly protein N-terminal domain-containing protein [Candidatus Acidoferrales bacterium]